MSCFSCSKSIKMVEDPLKNESIFVIDIEGEVKEIVRKRSETIIENVIEKVKETTKEVGENIIEKVEETTKEVVE